MSEIIPMKDVVEPIPAMPRVATIVHFPKRPYLACVRIGNNSVFERWFRPDRPRTWDLLLSYYRLPDCGLSRDAEIVSIGGISKFSAIKDIHDKEPSIFSEYKAIWFLDDDLEISFEDVDIFFKMMSELGLSLAQPSLSKDSPISFFITTNDTECLARYTNFVEIMMPAFSQAAFRLCVETFDKAISGWGLDYVWPKMLGYPDQKIGIVDAIVVKHTKPMDVSGGAFYRYLKSLGVNAREELLQLRKDFCISDDQKPKTFYRIVK